MKRVCVTSGLPFMAGLGSGTHQNSVQWAELPVSQELCKTLQRRRRVSLWKRAETYAAVLLHQQQNLWVDLFRCLWFVCTTMYEGPFWYRQNISTTCSLSAIYPSICHHTSKFISILTWDWTLIVTLVPLSLLATFLSVVFLQPYLAPPADQTNGRFLSLSFVCDI